jgi:hypothetical protein
MGRFAPFRMPPVAEDTGMHSQNISLIACRLWAFLFAGIAMAATAIGALALYWAVFGIPEDLTPQFEDDLPSQARFFMAVLGAIAVVVGLFHATLSVPAALGRLWALVVGTLFWVLVIGPLLGQMFPGTAPMNMILPVVFASLMLAALLSQQRIQSMRLRCSRWRAWTTPKLAATLQVQPLQRADVP